MTLKTLCIAQDPAADRLLTDEPLALLLGMLLDQQVPMETAFRGPAKLRERLGHLDAPTIATADPERFAAAMSTPPAVHRYPGSMGGRIQALCQTLVAEYDGRAEAVWETAEDGRELLARLRALPGFGDQKARIFLALLGKQLGVCPTGWRDALRRRECTAVGRRRDEPGDASRGAGVQAGGEGESEGNPNLTRERPAETVDARSRQGRGRVGDDLRDGGGPGGAIRPSWLRQLVQRRRAGAQQRRGGIR